MSQLKKVLKYVILILAIYFFSKFLIYIGLNATYRDIYIEENIPSQIKIEYAQATKVNGRILGKISNNGENLNGKYIKTNIYNSNNELLGTKYISIEGLSNEETKKFAVYFKKDNVDHCEVSIIDKKDENTEKLFDGIFLSEDLKTHLIISALIYGIFFV